MSEGKTTGPSFTNSNDYNYIRQNLENDIWVWFKNKFWFISIITGGFAFISSVIGGFGLFQFVDNRITSAIEANVQKSIGAFDKVIDRQKDDIDKYSKQLRQVELDLLQDASKAQLAAKLADSVSEDARRAIQDANATMMANEEKISQQRDSIEKINAETKILQTQASQLKSVRKQERDDKMALDFETANDIVTLKTQIDMQYRFLRKINSLLTNEREAQSPNILASIRSEWSLFSTQLDSVVANSGVKLIFYFRRDQGLQKPTVQANEKLANLGYRAQPYITTSASEDDAINEIDAELGGSAEIMRNNHSGIIVAPTRKANGEQIRQALASIGLFQNIAVHEQYLEPIERLTRRVGQPSVKPTDVILVYILSNSG